MSDSAEKSLPEGADGDDSVQIDNGVYSIDVGETESGNWIWNFDGHTTLYHEFFSLQQGDGEVYRSYEEASIETPFPDSARPGEAASTVTSMTVDGVEVLVKRTVQMAESDPTFTMKYDVTNVGESSLQDLQVSQYADFDDGPSDYWDDVGHYVSDQDMVYVRDSSGSAYAGFSANQESENHHVGEYPAYSEVKNDSLNNNDRYPVGSGDGDAVVVLEWNLGTLGPGESDSITLQFGADTTYEELQANVETPSEVETSPPGSATTTVGTAANVISWIPGLSENEDDGGNDLYSLFPDQGPIPGFPIDEAFIGSGGEVRELGETVEETLEMEKDVDGIDGTHPQYRFKNTVTVSFEAKSGKSLDRDSPIKLEFNAEVPGNTETRSRLSGETPTFDFDLLNPDDPENLPETILEENINENPNLSIIEAKNIWDYFGEHDRSRPIYTRARYATAVLDEFTFRGENVEGVRVATLWGGENIYNRELVKKGGPLPGSNPLIYHWVDLVILADGTYAIRIQDTTQFPVHTLYSGPPGKPNEQYRRTDSGLEVIFDTDATTNNEYAAAVHEDNHKPWGQFYGSWDDNTTYVPYRTPKKRYLKNHNNDSTGRWFGYKNELLVDHPVMTYGRSSDGEDLSESEVLELLPEPQSPFPNLFPYAFE